MSKKNEFLDFTQQHVLTEQECELISFFRTLSKTKRQAVMQALFSVLLNGQMKKEARKKKS